MTSPAPYDPLLEARRLLRGIRVASLSTLMAQTGFPVGTLTTIASGDDGSPILLLSQLSLHTRNLDADGRCSLLLAQTGKGDPLAHPRLTLVGTATKVIEPALRAQLRQTFLAQNPKAGLYADFGDFSFWQFAITIAHLNGGFGKAADFTAAALLAPAPPLPSANLPA